MTDVAYQQRFQRGAASADLIGGVVREVLAEVGVPSSEATWAADGAGLDPTRLAGARVEITEGEQGAEPLLTTIVVSIAATAGSKVLESFCTHVIWPESDAGWAPTHSARGWRTPTRRIRTADHADDLALHGPRAGMWSNLRPAPWCSTPPGHACRSRATTSAAVVLYCSRSSTSRCGHGRSRRRTSTMRRP